MEGKQKKHSEYSRWDNIDCIQVHSNTESEYSCVNKVYSKCGAVKKNQHITPACSSIWCIIKLSTTLAEVAVASLWDSIIESLQANMIES